MSFAPGSSFPWKCALFAVLPFLGNTQPLVAVVLGVLALGLVGVACIGTTASTESVVV